MSPTAEYNLGTARGRVVIDYDGAGIDKAKAGVDDLSKKAGASDQQLNTMARGMGLMGAAIAGGLAVAVKSAATFEQSLSGIKAVSGATEAEMGKVSAKALQLGADTKFSAAEGALAIEELAKAGLTLPDILNGAADAAVNLAAAGEIDLPQAAMIASNAMNQFNLAAEDMVNVADKIAGAANTSAIDVSDFGQSLTMVGAVANLAGISFDDTAAAIGLLGNAGIKGSDAGTSLKTMFLNLQPSTEKAAGVFKDLGIIMEDGTNRFYDAEGSLKSLSEISGVLKGSLEGLTDAEKTMALETMFGTDAIRAAAVLANEGAEGFDTFATSMAKTSAADVAKTRMDNFAGSLEQMKGSLETLAITLGTVLLPPLRTITDKVTELLNWFMQLSPETQKIIVIFATVAASLLLMGAAMIKIYMFAKNLKAAFMALQALTFLKPLMATIFGPWGLAIMAIIALAYLIYKNWDTIKALLIDVWEAIKGAFSAAWEFISNLWSSWMGEIKQEWETFLNALKAVWTTIWDAIKAVFQVVVDAIKAVITTYVAIWTAIITTALNAIKAVWSAVWGLFGPLVKAIFDLIVAIFTLFWTIVKGLFLIQLNLIKTIVETVFNAIKAFIQAVMNGIKLVIETVWNAIKPFVMAAVTAIKTTIETVFNAAKAVVSTIFNAIKSAIQAALDAAKAVVSSAVGGIKSAIGALSSLVGTVAGFFGGILDSIKDKMGEAVSFMAGLGGRILGAVGNLGSLLYDKGKEIVQGLIDGITAMIGKVTDAIGNVTGKISKFLPGSPVKEGPLMVLNRGYAGGQIMKMLAGGMEGELGAIENVLRNMSVAPILDTAASLPPVAGVAAPVALPDRSATDADFAALLESVEGLRAEVRRQTDRNLMWTRTELERV